MPIEILMPALSPTMQEGNLARWLKKEGEVVKSGDAIAEIETDKATMEVEAADEGILAKILVPGGTQGVKVNQPIALLVAEGEDVAAPKAAPAPVAKAPPPPPKSPANGKAPPVLAAKVAAADDDRVNASPLARRVAKDAGIDLSKIQGSGPHGRIVVADLEASAGKAQALAPAVTAAPPVTRSVSPAQQPIVGGPAYTELPLSSMRRVIATRLAESKQTIPHFYMSVDCVIDKLLAMRAELNARSSDYKISVNDFVIRASALALRKVPAANASFADTVIRLYSDVDISVAVATGGGLITPIIRHADQKGLAAIAKESKALSEKARAGKLMPEDYQGGTFSISNLGMYGIRQFEAVINPPQGCILAVGAAEQRPIVKNGALAIATVMTCTLSVDHRVVDGAVGAELLTAFKALIEDPLTMLL